MLEGCKSSWFLNYEAQANKSESQQHPASIRHPYTGLGLPSRRLKAQGQVRNTKILPKHKC